MSFYQYFYEYLYFDFEVYIVFLILSMSAYYYIFRKYIVILIDPLCMLIFYLSVYAATVMFMLFENIIDIRFFWQYLASTLALLAGMFIIKPFRLNHIQDQYKADITQEKILKVIYVITVFFYIINEGYLVLKIGFPAFNEVSRLLIYQDVGLNKRISDMLLPILISLICLRIFKNNYKNKIDILLSCFIFINLSLSGSKGAFANLIFILLIVSFFYSKFFAINKKYQYKLLTLILILFATVIFILSGKEGAFETFFVAIVGRGDGYVNFYGSDYSSILDHFYRYDGIKAFLMYIFAAPLTLLRIIPYTDIDMKFPDILNEYVYGHIIMGQGVSDVYNILSFAYLGVVGSVIYSFCVGLFYSYCRNKLIYVCRNNVVMQIFYANLLLNLNGIIVSISVFMEQTTLFIIGYFLLIVVANFIVSCLYSKNSKKLR